MKRMSSSGNGTVTKRNRVKRESTREVHLAVTQRWKREPKKRNMHPCFGYRQTKWLIVDETFCPESIENMEKQAVVVKTNGGAVDIDVLENGYLAKHDWNIVKEILFLGGNK